MKRIVLLTSTLAIAGTLGTAAIASADSTPTATKTAHHVRHGDRDDRRVRLQARLNQAVRDGTITAAQKTAFEAELKMLASKRKTDLGSHPIKAQRQAERTKLDNELKAWASSNNFPLSTIMPKL